MYAVLKPDTSYIVKSFPSIVSCKLLEKKKSVLHYLFRIVFLFSNSNMFKDVVIFITIVVHLVYCNSCHDWHTELILIVLIVFAISIGGKKASDKRKERKNNSIL
jgi:hypothetical protein